MYEGQGYIVVSGDYKADAYKLVDVLSRFEFSDCGEKPLVNTQEKLVFPNVMDFPHALPQITLCLDELGNEISNDQLERGFDPSEFVTKKIDLEVISKDVSPYIIEGVLELSAVWQDRYLCCHYSNLKIYPSGKVELLEITKSTKDNFHNFEVYEK